MKRYLHFYYWLAAIVMMLCNTLTLSAQVKVTSLSQLKAGDIIVIYPKDSNGTSHYGETDLALAYGLSNSGLTSLANAQDGGIWTLIDAGDGYYYLKNKLGFYWAYQESSSSTSLRCTYDQSSAVKVSLSWDSKYGGVCFWNQQDGRGLNNLFGHNNQYNWYSSKTDYNSSDANTTFDVSILQWEWENLGENALLIKDDGIEYCLYRGHKIAEVNGITS